MSLEIHQHEREGITVLEMKGRITLGKEATAMRRADMRRRGLPKDRPFSTEDHSGWGGCPYCTKLLQPHPDGRAMAIEAAASGMSPWRCC